MKPLVKHLVLLFAFSILLNACMGGKPPMIPPYDEVLVYELPFDLTYLRTLEALENIPGWELEETEKEKGIIVARNVRHTSLEDAEKRTATLFISRVNRGQTTVQLAPRSRWVIGGAALMKKISEYVGREL